MTDWTRKNAFVRKLREMLRGFRILGVEINLYNEVAPTDETLGRLHGVPTGRAVIEIKLKGVWRK